LSARITRARYLKETTKLSDQKTSERMPSTLSWLSGTACGAWWPNASFIAYSGEVPMSPYTTPIAARARAAVVCL
jgi:hypothetical protein